MPHPLLIFSQSDYLIKVVHANSNTEWQTVQIQISWLLQKPTDLDLHCLQRQDISGCSRTMVNLNRLFSVWQCIWTDAYTVRSISYKPVCFLHFKINCKIMICFWWTGNGATWLDPHTAQWVAPVVTTRYYYACQGDARKPIMGWRENCCDNLQVNILTFFWLPFYRIDGYCWIYLWRGPWSDYVDVQVSLC